MANLKAGRLTPWDADSLAGAIEQAMKDEWQNAKGFPLPAPDGEEDRRILFVAIARGVLEYLQEHKLDITTTSVLGDVEHSHTIEFTLE